MSDIEQNLQAVQKRIQDAAARADRDPREITLVAVSKTFPAEAVVAAYQAGVKNFGENRVEEAIEKIPEVQRQVATIQRFNDPTTQRPNDSTTQLTWHLIGHLQHRKVKDAVELFDFIHSVDSTQLAHRIEKRAAAIGKTMPVLLEVNVSGEASKYGFAPEPREEFLNAVREILTLPHLDVQGLMTIAPLVEDAEQTRPYFRRLRELRDRLREHFPGCAWQHLSMGMTNDFEVAIEEGATMIRIGRAIFGERK